MAGRREAWNERAPLIKEKTERKNEDFFEINKKIHRIAKY